MPDPWASLSVVADERQRLRIIDDHEVVTELTSYCVLVHNMLVDPLLSGSEVDGATL